MRFRMPGFFVRPCLGQQLRARSPIRLVFGEPRIGGWHGLKSGAGTVRLRDGQSAIDCDDGRAGMREQYIV